MFVWEPSAKGEGADPGVMGITAYMDSRSIRERKLHLKSAAAQLDISLLFPCCHRLCNKVTACLVNFVAPCLVRAEVQAAILKFMQHNLADLQNTAVLLAPLFSYKKNGRYNEEKAVMQRVQMTGAQMDRVFSLLFAEKTARPPEHVERICSSVTAPAPLRT